MYDPVKYWSKRTNPNRYDTLQTWDLKVLKPLCNEAQTILDYGSGNGRTFSLYKGKDVTCFDITDIHLDVLKLKSDINTLSSFVFIKDKPLEGKFDIGILNKVLLHEENPEYIIETVSNVCDKVFISTGINCDSGHCFDHDYKKLLKDYDIMEWDLTGNDLTIVIC
jgi:2-polyprenyl-3-methyl-5-hydroxy-6-metoxy-1,4-benzoquinol methylase